MNFARDVVDRAPPGRRALVELTRDGARRVWTFGEVADHSQGMAGTLHAMGVRRGDVVMTLIGNRPDWVFTMVACFRIGAVVLPCNEQLRAHDLQMRIDVAQPTAIVVDERNRSVLERALAGCRDISVLATSGDALHDAAVPPAVELADTDPCLITFTSGTSGDPKAVLHLQRYLTGQRLQADHWLAPRPGDLVWCTATSGWSKSARNTFVAPWIRGAAGVLHDARFDAAERLEHVRAEQVNVLCMSPTEYRVIAKRAAIGRFEELRGLVSAGEALNPEILATWRDATGIEIRDGFGQTETGQLTANPVGEPCRPGSMGRPLPGVDVWVDDGELVVDPATVPTFFGGYLHEPAYDRRQPWRTGDRVEQDDHGHLHFVGRTDDVIISAGYRIGPFEVESALESHPSVAESAVVAAPDDERGSIVRAIVVLREAPTNPDVLVAELQDHVKRHTAPYKYPRIVEFRDELPRTASGKVRRALLRDEGGGR